ncbi:MAG: hypothetical protein H6710_05300 [Myxococcales bacterium]|nr:hypothetical protein [Myxococcales bacterium]MCB9704351.1 hypothetical protein [Myxococcales bacterium]
MEVQRGRQLALAGALLASAAPLRADARPPAKPGEIRPLPRLQLAVAPVIGPMSQGELDCRPRAGGVIYCEDGGTFLGAGGSLELRAKVYGPFFIHGRGLVVGNIRQAPRAVHAGMGGGGVGIGAYHRLAFIRAEYLVVGTFGSDRYKPPFGDLNGASDVYDHHAGLISGGIRYPFAQRLSAELWGGFMIGPRAHRTTPFEVSYPDRLIYSFLVGAGLAFDLIRGRAPAPASAPVPSAASPSP